MCEPKDGQNAVTRDNSKDPTPYAVLCSTCIGPQFLTEAQYQVQLERDDCEWRCPKCRDLAFWDDDCQETS